MALRLRCSMLGTAGLPGRRSTSPTETVVRFTVHPMAAPKPALKYQLLPELREMNPGNPIQGYLTCFMEQTNFFHNKEVLENREKWQTLPLKELPLKEMHNTYSGGGPLGRADYAARLDAPDWQVLLKLKREGINLLLPEFQELRNLSGALKVRFRLEVAEHRFDDAVVTAKTIFALSRHMADHPTFIANLVATAVAFQGVGPLEEDDPAAGLSQPVLGLDQPAHAVHRPAEGATGRTSLAGQYLRAVRREGNR